MKSKVKLYYNTIKYMRKDQLFFRLKFMSKKFFYRNFNNLIENNYLNKSKKILSNIKISHQNFNLDLLLETEAELINEKRVKELMNNKFSFLNYSHQFGEEINWSDQNLSQLWNYNLHYFDYLIDLAYKYKLTNDNKYYNKFKKLINSWIDNNPLGQGDGWHPYPVSLRLINWIKAASYFLTELENDSKFKDKFIQYIIIQALYIKNNLEYDVRGNHLLENIRALLAVSLFLDKKNWLSKAEKLLNQQIKEQILEDGGHFERTPMYHLIVLYDLLEIAYWLNTSQNQSSDHLNQKINKMLEFLQNILHPDENIPLFNDSTLDIAKNPDYIFKLAQKIGYKDFFQTNNSLDSSGYFTIRNNENDFLIVDCGKVCPDYLPAHAHNDLLSYELSLEGKRIIIDTGVYEYSRGQWRDYNRSTKAHNTVQVDLMEQSAIWGNFRVAERAKVLSAELKEAQGLKYFVGKFKNYNNFYTHQRYVITLDAKIYIFIDKIKCRKKKSASSFIHLNNEITVKSDIDKFKLINSELKADYLITPFNNQQFKIHYGDDEELQGWYSPEFGKKFKNQVIELKSSSKEQHLFGYFISKQRLNLNFSKISTNNKNDFTLQFDYNDKNHIIKEENNRLKLEVV